jgi:hypothetical protein
MDCVVSFSGPHFGTRPTPFLVRVMLGCHLWVEICPHTWPHPVGTCQVPGIRVRIVIPGYLLVPLEQHSGGCFDRCYQ